MQAQAKVVVASTRSTVSRHQVVAAALGLTKKLKTAEDSLDATLVEYANLMAGLVETRKELGLPPGAGSEAFAKVSDAIKQLTEARAATVQAHAACHEVAMSEDLPVHWPDTDRVAVTNLRLAS